MNLDNVINLTDSRRNKLILVAVSFMTLILLIPPMYAPDETKVFAAKPINDCEEFDPEGVDFHLEEATIADIHEAILAGEITSLQLVCLYFDRILEYGNDQCATYPEGFLGPIEVIPDSGETNAYQTVNLRPDARENIGFDDLKTRSTTDNNDNNPKMPDALEVAAALDAEFAKTGELVGPLHGIPIALKDQVDTFDMRTTSGGNGFYDNDRPPDDAGVTADLREAGAIIIGKAQTGEYARGSRSSFGGQTCNPYDVTRSPSGSSAGSGVVPAANLAVCAIAEDSSGSIRGPASVNNAVGIRPSFGLISTDGLFFSSLTFDTLGPICRTVMDTAIVFDVLAGFDPADPRTVLSIGRIPSEPYSSFADENSLDGIRIGVVREVLVEKSLADKEVLRVIEEAIDDMESLGAEMIDVSLKDAIAEHLPSLYPGFLTENHPELFTAPPPDTIDQLLAIDFDPSLVPADDIIAFGEHNFFRVRAGDGETKYGMNFYLVQRGDKDIDTIATLIDNQDSFTPSRLEGFNSPTVLDNTEIIKRRSAVQQIVLIMMADDDLDALIYQGRGLPVAVLTAPSFPGAERPLSLNRLSPLTGFPAIAVPAGFSEVAFDRVIDEFDENVLVGPNDVEMPISIELLGKPFDEATLFKIASAYEAFTNHRAPPPDFPPLPNEP